MEVLLDFSKPLDVSPLDQVVQLVYTGTAEQIQQAQGTLTQLQERIAGEDAAGALNWFRVDQVLDSPTLSANTKYYALQVGRPPPTLARRAARADAPPPPPPRRRSSRR